MLEWLKKNKNYVYDAIQVQINRLKAIESYDMAQALNPVYIVTAKKFPQKKSLNVIKLPVETKENNIAISSVAATL